MKRLTKNQINQIKRLRTKDHTFKEIEVKTGISYQQVRYHASKIDKEKKAIARLKEITKPVKNVTPKKMAVPTPAVFDEDKVREYMTGYLDGLSIKYDIPRADIDRVVFSVLQLPLSVRLFG